MKTSALASLVLALLLPGAAWAQLAEPSVFICGIWPDRVLFYDQVDDVFVDGFELRHGAATGSSFTPDRSRFFVITDRMESVEVIDPIRRELVGEFKLSTSDRRIRIFDAIPNHDATLAYVIASVVRLETDRFVREDEADIFVVDVASGDLVEEFKLPDEVDVDRVRELHVSPDGASLFLVADDIYEMDAETREVKDKLVLSKPLLAGYGSVRGLNLTETEPGVFYGIYRTRDPVQERSHLGLAKLELYDKKISTFELGPNLRVGRFALSPDGRRGYAGLTDLVVIDMETKRVLTRKEDFERGRTNNSLIVSHDGSKLYVSGVGDTMYVYDAETLEPIKTVFAGGDFMMPPREVPAPGGS